MNVINNFFPRPTLGYMGRPYKFTFRSLSFISSRTSDFSMVLGVPTLIIEVRKKKIDNHLQPLLQQSNIMNFLPVEKKRTRGSGVLLLWFFLETCSSSIVQPCACICTKSLAKPVNPIKYEHTLETSSLPAREF